MCTLRKHVERDCTEYICICIYSSDDDGCQLSATCGSSIKDDPWNGDLSSEDEPEKDTNVEETLLATFNSMTSPAANREADSDHMTSDEPCSVDHKSDVESKAEARGQRRKRRSSGAGRKKVVKFSLDDGSRGEPSEG